MRPSGARLPSTEESFDSRDSTSKRRAADDEAPMFYGLCYCRTWAGRYLHAVASPSFPDAEDETEYRQHTYNTGRAFLVWVLLALACLYSVGSLRTAYLRYHSRRRSRRRSGSRSCCRINRRSCGCSSSRMSRHSWSRRHPNPGTCTHRCEQEGHTRQHTPF